MLKVIMLIIWGWNFALWAQNNQQSLVLAIEMDNVAKVSKMILSGQASIDEKIDNDEPIIIVAARAGAEKVTKFLISMKCDINALNSYNESALMMAVYFSDNQHNGQFEIHDRIAKMLIEDGANLENGNWWTPLTYAAYSDRYEITKYLLKKGAVIDGPINKNITPIKTPLMMAAMQGNDKLARLLLTQGANAKIQTIKGHTAYTLAEKNNFKGLLKDLKCAMSLEEGESYKEKCFDF